MSPTETRGPKSQIKAQRRKYSAGKSLVLWVEVGLALYFLGMLVMAVMRHQWASLPFLGLFFFGFAYVAGGSLAKRWNLGAWFSQTPAEPPPPVPPLAA